jgi:hypothetical protein
VVAFDPYLNWLGIAPHEQPPSLYRLLGIVLFESNPEVIEQAADRQSLRVGAYQSGPQGEMCQQLLSEIAMARFRLLDPQQKAAYDSQLNETLSRRGERAVAAPPPPASSLGGQQYGLPSPQFGAPGPQFGSQASPQFGSQPPSFAAPQSQFNQPSQFNQSPPSFGPQGHMGSMHGSAAASPPMPMPPAMMPSQGFMPSMPARPPAAIPVAAPFPTPVAKQHFPAPAPKAPASRPGPPAPPSIPPAAPQRPIDELESLAATTSRYRVLKKKKKADYSKQIVIATVVMLGAIVLGAIYIATAGNSHRGFNAIENEATEPSQRQIDSARRMAEEIRRKEKERERERKAAASSAANAPKANGEKANGETVKPSKTTSARPAADVDTPIVPPINVGPPPHAMDAPAKGQSAESTPPAEWHDTPQDLGGDKDPVMELPK